MKVTAEYLHEQGACEYETRRFKKLHPHGLKITLANLMKTASEGFDVRWLIDNCLLKKFDNLWWVATVELRELYFRDDVTYEEYRERMNRDLIAFIRKYGNVFRTKPRYSVKTFPYPWEQDE